MHASLSAIYLTLLLPVSVLGGPVNLPSTSDSEVAQRDPLSVVSSAAGSIDERSLPPPGNAEPVPQLQVRDDDDDDDDDNVFENIKDDVKDSIDDTTDDIKDGFNDTKDDVKDSIDDTKDDVHDKVDEEVDDAFDDGVGSVRPELVTVGVLAVAVAAGLM